MATFVLLADFILNVVLPNLCEIFSEEEFECVF